MKKPSIIFGIDPGTTKAGWAQYDLNNKTVVTTGHSDWLIIRDMLKNHNGLIHSCVVEQVIMHTGLPASKYIMNTAHNVGRIQQVCSDEGIDYIELPRIEICTRVTGSRPTRGNRITKKDMQDAVQKHLGLNKPVRPQHANDAMAAIIAEYPHGTAQAQQP